MYLTSKDDVWAVSGGGVKDFVTKVLNLAVVLKSTTMGDRG